MFRVAKYAVVFSLSSGLCMANTAASMSGLMSGVGQLAQVGQQMQQQRQEQATQERALAQEEAQINSTVNQNTNNPQTSPYTVPQNLPNASNGYPILDPYANAQYWTQRGHQFKFSMDVAGKRAELQNKKAKMMLEAEKNKTAAMLKGLGEVMKVAGDQMTVIGNNRAKAQQEEQTKARNGLAQRCNSGASTCEERQVDGRTVVVETPTATGDETPEPVTHTFENEEELNAYRDGYDVANRATEAGISPGSMGGFQHNGELIRDDQGNIVRDEAEALRIVQARKQAAAEATRAEAERAEAARAEAEAESERISAALSSARTHIQLATEAEDLNATNAARLVNSAREAGASDQQIQNLLSDIQARRDVIAAQAPTIANGGQ